MQKYENVSFGEEEKTILPRYAVDFGRIILTFRLQIYIQSRLWFQKLTKPK